MDTAAKRHVPELGRPLPYGHGSDHYDTLLGTGLTAQEKIDLIAYLRTL